MMKIVFFTEELYLNQEEIPRNHFLIPKAKSIFLIVLLFFMVN